MLEATIDVGAVVGKWRDPIRLYILFAPFLYLAFALFTPPFETPDEHQHLFRAWQLSEFELVAEKRGDTVGGELPPGLARAAAIELGTAAPHADRYLPRTTWNDRFTRATPVSAASGPVFTDFVGSASYSPVGYVPQVLAIWSGQALGFSVEAIIRMGRLLNAGLAFALFCAAFRVLPTGRMILMVIGLLPMTAACAGSFGQDGLVIGASAWLVALGLRAADRGHWSKVDGVTAGLLGVVITLAKFVYLPLLGLALLVGRGNNLRRRIALQPLVSGLAAGVLLLFWLHLNAGLSAPMMPGRPIPVDQARHLISHPYAFPSALAATLGSSGLAYLWGTLFKFGWLNIGPVGPASALSLVSLLLAIWNGDMGAASWSLAWRGWLLVIAIAVILPLCLALYLTATPLGWPVILGLQGRYFIPVLLPLALAFQKGREEHLPWLAGALFGEMLIANLAALSAIAGAYYL